MIKSHFPEFKTIGNIKLSSENGSGSYYFSILAQDLKNYKKLIGFLHPEKMRKLELAINIQNRGWKRQSKFKTKLQILNSLRSSSMSSYEISKEIKVTRRTIEKMIKGYFDDGKYYHGLLEEGLVKPIKKTKYGTTWLITQKGQETILTS